MESETSSQNIQQIVKQHLSCSLKGRVGRLVSLGKKASPDFSQGQNPSQEIINLLLRQFYLILADAKDQIYNMRTPKTTISDFIKGVVDDLARRFGLTTESVTKYIENNGIIERRTRGPIVKKGEEFKEEVISRVQEQLMIQKPQSFKDVHQHFVDIAGDNISYSTARRRFLEWGGSLERVISTENLKNREYVQENKRIFLKEVNSLLNQNFDIIFLDESYIHERTVASFSLTIGDVHLQKASGKGKRSVIFGAVGRDGWVGRTQNFKRDLSQVKADDTHGAGSIAYWVANQRGDYHLNFDKDVFLSRFKKKYSQKITKTHHNHP